MNRRQHTLLIAGMAMLCVWGAALGGYIIAKNSKVTPEKILAYMQKVDLRMLTKEQRAAAISKLAKMMNALPTDERRETRRNDEWPRWFKQMTEEEKENLIEATMPTGFKRILTAFEELPPDKRKRAVDDAMRRLKETRDPGKAIGLRPRDAKESDLSKDLQEKVMTIGLRAYFTQASAQTKAELAPLMEELQRAMESGRLFRGR